MVEVLLLHRHLSDTEVCAGLKAAVAAGAATADVVAVEARKAAEHAGNDQVTAPGITTSRRTKPAARVASLTERRLIDAASQHAARADRAALPVDTRPLPSVAHYDQLLRRRPAPQHDGTAAPGADGSTTGRMS